MLDAHLAHCSACRLEREVRLDFADEMAADSPVHDGSLLLVTRVLEKTEPPPALEASSPETRPLETQRAPDQPELEEQPIVAAPRTAARPRRQLRMAVLIAAALMLAGVAGARVTGVWSVILSPESTSTHPAEETTLPLDVPTAKAIEPTHVAPLVSASVPASVPAPEPVVNAPMVAAAVPAPPVRAPILAAATAATTSAPAQLVPAVSLTPEPPRAEDDPNGAPSLFAHANSARRQGEHARAAGLYRDLLARHPDAAEASATRVALGRLLLDDGDAASALPFFETYLRSGDPSLREEAMLGRARAQGRLGHVVEERAAWSALVQGYPQSIHAARAHARLEELGHR